MSRKKYYVPKHKGNRNVSLYELLDALVTSQVYTDKRVTKVNRKVNRMSIGLGLCAGYILYDLYKKY